MNDKETQQSWQLTQYSHGAGCGCKIAPAVLDRILRKSDVPMSFPGLLVGNEERDDAAVMDLGDGTAIVSTTDFFMPIVDDPFDFGRIASVNAISDIYAMGATPLMAIAILGWPINEIPPSVANAVIEGGRQACKDAGIPLAGGHSIDSPEPIFGLAVTGRVSIDQLKKNGGAKLGDLLYLSKGLGVGILSTAQKKGKLQPAHRQLARNSMTTLNRVGSLLGKHSFVHAMTDVTGFGLLGHLSEMCEASDCSAELDFDKIPFLDKEALDGYLAEGCVPGGTRRNWDSYGHKIGDISEYQRHLLCDPQTSGGLLVAVDPAHQQEFEDFCASQDLSMPVIGRMVASQGVLVNVR
ncbi:MAG: selenide, water dikinase SelD [Bacteroidota bacterium]